MSKILLSKKLKIIFGLVIFLSLFFVGSKTVSAATRTWDGGGGADTNWSTCANWDGPDICPIAGDTVTFNGTSTNNSTVDAGFGGSIGVINVNSGYTGTITLAETLAVTSTMTVSAGTFTASNQSLSVASTFTLNTGGIFTASSGTTTFSAAFTITGGTFNHNSGTVTFNSSTTVTLSCNSATFNLVTFNNSGAIIVSSNCSFPFGANPTLSGAGNIILNGTFSGSGTLTKASGTLQLNSGSVLSGFTGISLNTLTINGATADFSSYTSFTTSSSVGNVTILSGTLTLPSGADLNGALVISGGTFNAPSGTMTLAGALTISGTPTFNANGGTITFDGGLSVTLSCNSVTFNLVTFNHTTGVTKVVSSNCSLPLGASPTIPNALTLNGTLTGSGTINYTGSNTFTYGTTGAISGFTGLNFSNGGFTLNGTLNLTSFSTVTFNVFTLNTGAIMTAPTGTMTVNNNFTISGGTFNANGGTVAFGGGNATLTCNNITFNLVSFTHTSATKVVGSTCSLPLGSNPTLGTGNSSTGVTLNGTLSGSGTLTTGVFTLNSGSVLSGFSGIHLGSVFTVAGATANFSGYSTFSAADSTVLSSGSLSLSPTVLILMTA